MAETPPHQSPARTQPDPNPDHEPTEYWCYHCDKRVAVETLPDLPDLICFDCKNGFVEAVPAAAAANIPDDPNFGNQFVHVLRLIAQAARENHAPPNLPTDPTDEDYLRIELDGWDDNDNDDEDEDQDEEQDEDEDEHSVEIVNEVEGVVDNNRNRSDHEDEDEDQDEDEDDADDVDEDEEERRRRRREVLRLRLRDFASRAASRRNRILDWAEILMGLEDHSIELRLQVPDTYVGNPGDYVDAAGYEALLQNLAESGDGGRRGAPPASKLAVDGLESVLIGEEEKSVVCAICKDLVNVGEVAKNLPCGHGYHGECIVPWLGSRNTCPVCRFELPTDDAEYEEERKKRVVVTGLRAENSPGGGSSSSGGGGGGGDFGLD